MSSAMEEDDYFLKWEKHHSAFISYFSTLFRRSMLVDCTLAAEDKYIKAHRMVLMACSPYFEELLSDHCDNFPIVFLDIKFSELKSIVDFCYRGEVKVSFNELEGFLKAANVLQIRGLTDKSKSEKPGGSTPKLKRRHSTNNNIDNSKKCDSVVSDTVSVDNSGSDVVQEISDGVNSESMETIAEKKRKMLTPDLLKSLVKCELTASEENQGSDNSDVDTDDESESSIKGDVEEDVDVNELLMQATGSLMFPWSCNRCGEAFPTRKQYQDHRKNCFEVPIDHPWKCEQCPNTYKNKKDLIRHLNYCGKEQPRLVCDRCNNSYKYYRGLKRHQQYCGTDVKPLKCPECDKTYKYKRGLRRHQRRCAIFRALSFLQERGVNPVVTPELKLEKEKRTVPSMATLVCACGKGYKYERSFQRHRTICSGFRLSEPSQSTNVESEDSEKS
ncbi:zinc finger and BTB domain-containing protein 14 isoform X1 [Halyomorpha halys]|uniref:zinc finger and BTB domain-containing protein 14 isoform X1 n=1 Tax=Halyomorpha halys TaxID=286706 RepID=UPI0006D5106C|nr:zinc finger and BTB domain-containing protein 14-like isoform X1 [Halyomorpha halys]